ncbi:PREDICTED: cysteine-rich with EGF-like domain protein 2 [Tinamus guttatus]|uniref:cysteine-rich with EGF-like domain protein 2 n=1 Tax=Tinamus guttatus TaxID=94827 RepID=UPI00052F3751|nr:PREDICTED: cysteine-rich with EGF-like domain protein 2 [Tinamus guttatus]
MSSPFGPGPSRRIFPGSGRLRGRHRDYAASPESPAKGPRQQRATENGKHAGKTHPGAAATVTDRYRPALTACASTWPPRKGRRRRHFCLELNTVFYLSSFGAFTWQGLADTAKKNFGGGNTAWEEKTLSKYESSEIRLVEIIENLCDSSNFECNNMVEEHEEQIEKWWFKLKKKYPDLFKWFCIETIEVCCPPGTYGPDCLACRGGSERPCHGNGHCDGDGTRSGDGSCSCNKEYAGEFCLDCSDGYFSTLKNETHSICTACHAACKTCTGSSNKDCQDCKAGWIKNEDAACVDVDECDGSPCKDDQYCLNTNGSFSCKACDATCVGCTGEGSDKCKTCASGYIKEDENCTDINECNLPEKVCTRENEDCFNTKGSYKCVCSKGFEEKDGTCAPVVKTGEEVETVASEHSPGGHDDL